MELTERVWHLIAKVLNKEASSSEVTELHALLDQNQELKQQYELIDRLWQERFDNQDLSADADQTIQRIIIKAGEESTDIFLDTAPRRRSRLRRRVLLGIAIAIVSTIIFGTGLFKSPTVGETPASKISAEKMLVAKKGSRTKSLLPDGTVVWLNAGSRLYYLNDFSGKTREVRLEGEGYFDVVKQPNRPFIVHTGGVDIKVLGTVFNVKSYPEDRTIETTLYHGSVQVFREAESEKSAINLKPNQKLILRKEAANNADNLSEEKGITARDMPAILTIAPIDSTKKEHERFETAWLYSRLEFRGDNFRELAYKLERWYNVQITFSDEQVKKLNFNGSFERETVEQAFIALHAALPLFTYKINNHEISVASSR